MPKDYNWSAKSSKEEFAGILANMVFKGPGSAAEAVEMYGDEVVLSNFIANVRVTAQGGMRRRIEKRMKPDEITAAMIPFVPGVAMSRDVDPEQAFLAKYRSGDKKEKARMLELLKTEG
jgi:uncharacterized membrane protein YjjB (DUF3815 family)